jgi:signal transduction histidine kinase
VAVRVDGWSARYAPNGQSQGRAEADSRSTSREYGFADFLDRAYAAGVEQERARLARELHDHVGQTIVYLRYELGRLTALNDGRAVQHDLQTLCDDLRTLADELRTSLSDLRSEVKSEVDIVSSLHALAERVNRRGKIAVAVQARATARIPLHQEREFLWVAQEAVLNAEQHSQGKKVFVRWRCDASRADLVVIDDGVGMPFEADSDRYGLKGLRERAGGIGASLTIHSAPTMGTMVHMSREANVVSPDGDGELVNSP